MLPDAVVLRLGTSRTCERERVLRRMWPWVEVRRSPRRRAGFNVLSSAVAPTGDGHPFEISVSPSAYEIIAPTGDDHPSEYEVPASSSSTASITKDASFSTSRKAETKRARRKRTEESRRLRMLKKGNEKRLREEGRKSISTEPPKTSPQSHKGYSLDFGCCLNAPMAAQRPGRSKLSVCHKGLSGEFGCRFDIPMTEQHPTLQNRLRGLGRYPTRFVAGRRLKRGRVAKLPRSRTRSYPSARNADRKEPNEPKCDRPSCSMGCCSNSCRQK